MTDIERKALVGDLRLNDSEIYLPLLGRAADQIEADGRRIEELEGWKAAEEAHHHLLKRRIAELEAAIREITGT